MSKFRKAQFSNKLVAQSKIIRDGRECPDRLFVSRLVRIAGNHHLTASLTVRARNRRLADHRPGTRTNGSSISVLASYQEPRIFGFREFAAWPRV